MDLKIWIFMALMNASKTHGVNLYKWYISKRPSELDDKWNDISTTIIEMYDTALLETALYEQSNSCLSEKGKKEAIKSKRKLNIIDYNYVISYFPEMELKDKVETLETFILESIGLMLLVIFNPLPISSYVVGNNYFIIIYFILVILISFDFGEFLLTSVFHHQSQKSPSLTHFPPYSPHFVPIQPHIFQLSPTFNDSYR